MTREKPKFTTYRVLLKGGREFQIEATGISNVDSKLLLFHAPPGRTVFRVPVSSTLCCYELCDQVTEIRKPNGKGGAD